MKYNKHLDTITRVSNIASDTTKVRTHVGERTQLFPDVFFQEFVSSISQTDIIQYPDVSTLKQKLADQHGVGIDNVFITPGSEYSLAALFYAFVEEGTTVLMPEARFPMYDVYLQQSKGKADYFKYDQDLNGRLHLNLKTNSDDVRMIVVGNPNSPVGDCLTVTEFQTLEAYDCPIIIDQAYGEFGKTHLPINLIENNYVFVNTYSKAYGAAGIRVGYVIANKQIIELIAKYRLMYEVSGLSIKFAEYLIDNENVMQDYVSAINDERTKLQNIGVHVYSGNWIHLPAHYAEKLTAYTYKTGVTLPHYQGPLIRINIFVGLYAILTGSKDD